MWHLAAVVGERYSLRNEGEDDMDRKGFSGLVLLLFVAALSGAVSVRVPLVFASPTAVLAVSPSTIFDPALGPGSNFRINITIANVNNLCVYQFVLGYDNAILKAINFGRYPPLDLAGPSWIDDAAGTVNICSYIFQVGVTFVDPTPVAYIDFYVEGVGTSLLALRDSVFSDPYGNAISHYTYDGFFSNYSVPEFPFGFAVEFSVLFGVAFVMLQRRRRKT